MVLLHRNILELKLDYYLKKKSYDFTDEKLVIETAELLKLSLIQNLQEHGFPNFNNARRNFSEIKFLSDNIYYFEEEIIYPDNIFFTNLVFLTLNNNLWKIVSVKTK